MDDTNNNGVPASDTPAVEPTSTPDAAPMMDPTPAGDAPAAPTEGGDDATPAA